MTYDSQGRLLTRPDAPPSSVETQALVSSLLSNPAFVNGVNANVLSAGVSQRLGQSVVSRGAKFAATPYTEPTITLSAAGAATTITNATLYNGYETSARTSLPFTAAKPAVIGISPFFSYVGCFPQQAGGGAPDTVMLKSIMQNASGLDIGHMITEFVHYGEELEIIIKGQAAKLRVTVDGVDVILATSAASYIGGITLPGATGSVYNIKLDWSSTGGRARRHFRVEQTGFFAGIRTGPIDSIVPAIPSGGPINIGIGDSLFEGTNAQSRGMSLFGWFCQALGHTAVFGGSGGTGYTNEGSNARMKFIDRVVPPLNSWKFYHGGTGGTFTLTVTARGMTRTTSAIAYNASIATVLAAVVALENVGSGKVGIYGNVSGEYYALFREELASARDVSLSMDASSVTGVAAASVYCSPYLGNVKPCIPVDGYGNELPFFLTFGGGYNDSAASADAVAKACHEVWTRAQEAFPTVTILVFGPHCPSATISQALSDTDAAIMAQAALSLQKVNGAVPAVSQLGWANGTGKSGTTTGSGNTDEWVDPDGVHWLGTGHMMAGLRFAAEFAPILGL